MKNLLNKNRIMVTTPIYYMNGNPHLGHLYTSILADSLKKIIKINNPEKEVLLQSGSDYHGLKIQKSAEKTKINEKEYCDLYNNKFKELNSKFNLNFDNFVKTTDKNHIEISQLFFNKLFKNNMIELDNYTGLYDSREERFLKEHENINLIDKKFIEKINEQNYCLKFENFRNTIFELIKNDNLFNDQSLKKQILNEVKDFPNKISISRPLNRVKWGIKTPIDKNQTIYVWFEALLNYLNIGYEENLSIENIENNLKNTSFIHIIGKDIMRFHSILYPLILNNSSIKHNLMNNIYLKPHYHYISDNLKISKSYNNIIDPIFFLNKYGDSDILRIYLLFEGPEKKDNIFKELQMRKVYNNFNDIVFNFFSRILNNKILKNENEFILNQEEFLKNSEFIEISNLFEKLKNNNFDVLNSFEDVIKIFNFLNNMITEKELWRLENEELKFTLRQIFVIVSKTINYLEFICPNYYNDLLEVINIKNKKLTLQSKNFKKLFRGKI